MIYIYRGYILGIFNLCVFFKDPYILFFIYIWDMLGIFLCNYCIYIWDDYGMILYPIKHWIYDKISPWGIELAGYWWLVCVGK
jgi:hypothetical protein